jgi:hypothetical protein
MLYGNDIISSGLLIRFKLRLEVIAIRCTVGEGSTPNSAAISQAKLYLNARKYPGGKAKVVDKVAGLVNSSTDTKCHSSTFVGFG